MSFTSTGTSTAPLTILVDDRGESPYTFADLPREVSVLPWPLHAGDYSIPFATGEVAVKRYTLAALYDTLLDEERYNRFEMELAHLAGLQHACVLLEGDPIVSPAPKPRKTVERLMLTSKMFVLRKSYPAVEWLTLCGRRGAEIACYAWLLAASQRANNSLSVAAQN